MSILASDLPILLLSLGCISMLLGLALGLRKSSQKEAENHPGIPGKTQKWIKVCIVLGVAWVLETPFIFIDPNRAITAILATAGLFLFVTALIIHQAQTVKIRTMPKFGGTAAQCIALGSAIFGLLMWVVALFLASSPILY